MPSRRKRAAAAQLERMAESRNAAPEIEVEIVDDSGAVVTVENPDQEIIVEHAEDAGGQESGREQTEREPEEPDALTKLKAQYAENEAHLIRERQQRQEAERRADANANAAVQGEKQYREATLAAVENAIALAKSNISQAQQTAAVAASRGDWETHAKAIAVLTENSTQVQSLERAKSDVERAPEPSPQQYQRPAPTQADEFESQISGFPPRTQAWLREHKSDIYGNHARASLAEAAARTAELKGLPVESEEYFRFINEQMGYQTVTNGNSQGGNNPPPVQRQKQPQTPAAPAGRTTFGAGGGKTRRIQLNQEQRRAAVQLYSHLPEHEALAEYAKGVAEIDSGKSNLLWSRDKYKGGAGV